MNPTFRPATVREAAIIEALWNIAEGYADDPDDIPEPANRNLYRDEALAEVEEEFPAPPPVRVSIRYGWLTGTRVTTELPGLVEERRFDDPVDAFDYAARMRAEAGDGRHAIELRKELAAAKQRIAVLQIQLDTRSAEANKWRERHDEMSAALARANERNLVERENTARALIAERDAARDENAALRRELADANERLRLSAESRARAERHRIKGRDARGRFAPADLPRVEV